jgi:hypothetical protein
MTIICLDEERQKRNLAADPLVSFMQFTGLALTRANYLALAYPDGLPAWNRELESLLPWWAREENSSNPDQACEII